MSKTLQVRFDDEEFESLSRMAEAQGASSLSDFARQSIRMGMAFDMYAQEHASMERRSELERELKRKELRRVTFISLLVTELAEKAGLDVEAIYREATDEVEADFEKLDSFEAQRKAVFEGGLALEEQPGVAAEADDQDA